MSVITAADGSADRFRASWIISPREDLTWFIGSASAGYLAIALMWAGFPLLPLQLVWLFAIDGPHVIATVTRTYFDRAERKKLGWLLWILVPLLLVGPVMVFAGQAAFFFLGAFCWQQFHVVKQHVGFAMIYKSKNREREPFDRTIDRWFLIASLIVPLMLFLLRTHEGAPVPARHVWSGVAVGGYAVLVVVWLVRQVLKFCARMEMNWPKVGLLAVTVPLQWLALMFATRYGPAGALQAAIPLGLFHGLQYHRLLWFHNQNRYSVPGAPERNGLAAHLAGSVGLYLAVAIGLNFVLAFLVPQLLPYQAVQAGIWGVSFTHFFLDAKIWHVRHDKELAVALGMA